jgi:hypothetical protein
MRDTAESEGMVARQYPGGWTMMRSWRNEAQTRGRACGRGGWEDGSDSDVMAAGRRGRAKTAGGMKAAEGGGGWGSGRQMFGREVVR